MRSTSPRRSVSHPPNTSLANALLFSPRESTSLSPMASSSRSRMLKSCVASMSTRPVVSGRSSPRSAGWPVSPSRTSRLIDSSDRLRVWTFSREQQISDIFFFRTSAVCFRAPFFKFLAQSFFFFFSSHSFYLLATITHMLFFRTFLSHKKNSNLFLCLNSFLLSFIHLFCRAQTCHHHPKLCTLKPPTKKHLLLLFFFFPLCIFTILLQQKKPVRYFSFFFQSLHHSFLSSCFNDLYDTYDKHE